MKRWTITLKRAERLKHWKDKTGWGYTSICRRIEAEGRMPPHAETLSAWEKLQNNTAAAEQYTMVIDAYKALPEELYHASKGQKDPKKVPISDEAMNAIQAITDRNLSIDLLIKAYKAPKGMNAMLISKIKNKKTDAIKPEHQDWLISTHQALQSNRS